MSEVKTYINHNGACYGATILTVQWDEGNLEVEVEFYVELRGSDCEYHIECWFLNEAEMPRTGMPEMIRLTAREIAKDAIAEFS